MQTIQLSAYAKPTAQISYAVTAQLISTFVFVTRIIRFVFYLNPKFQASILLLWLYSLVCVRPGRKPLSLLFFLTGADSKAKVSSSTRFETSI